MRSIVPDDLRFIGSRPEREDLGKEQRHTRRPCSARFIYFLPCTEVSVSEDPDTGDHTMYMLLNLKVCEGCGSLWLRVQEFNDVYCSVCRERLREFP